MRLLIDSQAFLWMLLKDPRLSNSARRMMTTRENELVISMASLWEISVKMRLGRLKSLGSSVAYIRAEMNDYGIELLPIRFEHILQQEALPHHHGDPFDRMLIAQAIAESIPVLTHDEKFRAYDVKVLW